MYRYIKMKGLYDMENIVLEIKNVTKKYGRKKIIDDLSLKVEQGQVYGFLGPNGAGKTTTIKMIVGLIIMDSGSILINNYDIKKDYKKAMKNVGAIVENPDLYDYLTGMENIKIFARIHNVKKERIKEVVKLVGLEDRINDKVKKYSLGMKQRLGLAVVLLHEPKLLILDEPTNGLDPAGIKELRNLLKELAHKKKIAVFVSSHMLSEMQLMCDKIAIINKGKIVKVDDVNKIESDLYRFIVSDIQKSQKILKDVCNNYVEEQNLIIEYDKNVSDIVKLLIKNDIEVLSFGKKQDTIEQEFLKITENK